MKVDNFKMKAGTYYSYFIRSTNNGNNIRQYAPVFKVEVKRVREETYEDNHWLFSDEAIVDEYDRDKITKNLLEKLESSYLVDVHALSCDFYTTIESAELSHDKELQVTFSYMSPSNKLKWREKFYRKGKSKIEVESNEFYSSLTKREKEYVKWLSKNKVL
jgi:hypothetical protein